MGIGRSTGQRRVSGARAGLSRGAAGERGEGERKVMTGGPGSAAREAGRGRRCWAERAEGESWAAALGPVRERVGRAGRGKGEHGLGSEAVGLEAGFPIFLVFLSLFFFKPTQI